ncbi:MAG: hypothetical protein ABJE47_02075 [bacterium]
MQRRGIAIRTAIPFGEDEIEKDRHRNGTYCEKGQECHDENYGVDHRFPLARRHRDRPAARTTGHMRFGDRCVVSKPLFDERPKFYSGHAILDLIDADFLTHGDETVGNITGPDGLHTRSVVELDDTFASGWYIRDSDANSTLKNKARIFGIVVRLHPGGCDRDARYNRCPHRREQNGDQRTTSRRHPFGAGQQVARHAEHD